MTYICVSGGSGNIVLKNTFEAEHVLHLNLHLSVFQADMMRGDFWTSYRDYHLMSLALHINNTLSR